MRLKFEDVELLARKAGFDPQVSPVIAAISMGESGGNPLAHNPNAGTGDNSYGLMQINMLGGMGPERRAAFGLASDDELFDPLTNMKAAKKIYDSQGLGAWSVYKSGDYKNHLPQNFTPLQEVSAPSNKREFRIAAQSLGDEGPLAVAMGNIATSFGLGQPAPQRASQGSGQVMKVSNSGGDIVELGKQLQSMGFTVRENPHFGGVGQHSPGSRHYSGNAIDVTIQKGSPLLAGRPDSDWKSLTAHYGEQLRKMYPQAQVLHPGYDPVGGHHEHIHIGF